MSGLTLFWLASFAGALLFTAAGFFGARGVRRKDAVATSAVKTAGPDEAGGNDRAELAHALGRAKHAEEDARAARRDAEKAMHDLARSIANEQRDRDALDKQSTEISRLSVELDMARQMAREAQMAAGNEPQELARAREQVASFQQGCKRLQEQLSLAKQNVLRLSRELKEARVRAIDAETREGDESMRLAELEGVLLAVRSELDAASKKDRKTAELLDEQRAHTRQLQSEVEEARAAADALRVDNEALHREIALAAEESANAKGVLETVRDENANLRQAELELPDLQKHLAALEAENQRLRASEFALRARESSMPPGARSSMPPGIRSSLPPGLRSSLPPGTESATAQESGPVDGAALQQFVDDVVRTASVSAAAVTDELGFLVAGNGDHTEALAAFGAYLTEAGARACGLLPMHAVQRVSVEDDSGITLTARTIAPAPNELVLVTIGLENHMSPMMEQGERSL